MIEKGRLVLEPEVAVCPMLQEVRNVATDISCRRLRPAWQHSSSCPWTEPPQTPKGAEKWGWGRGQRRIRKRPWIRLLESGPDPQWNSKSPRGFK